MTDNYKTNPLIDIEKLGDMIKYTCKITKSYLVFLLFEIDDYVLLHESDFDWNQPKLIINLLNFAFNDVQKFNFNDFRYYVLTSEMEYIDIKQWTIVMQNEHDTLLECELKNAFSNVIDGFNKT